MPKTPTDSQESQLIYLKEMSDFEKIEYNSALFDIGLIFQKNIIGHYADVNDFKVEEYEKELALDEILESIPVA